MPIYEYYCEKCTAKEEVIQKVGEPAPAVCPNCKASGSLKKSVTLSSFHLKGGGWYKDLYSSNKPQAPKKIDESKSSPASDTKKEDKLDKSTKKDE